MQHFVPASFGSCCCASTLVKCGLLFLSEIKSEHRRLAEITEMIHTASLMHDDVLDDSDVRRGDAHT